jgi:hypothetical protein
VGLVNPLWIQQTNFAGGNKSIKHRHVVTAWWIRGDISFKIRLLRSVVTCCSIMRRRPESSQLVKLPGQFIGNIVNISPIPGFAGMYASFNLDEQRLNMFELRTCGTSPRQVPDSFWFGISSSSRLMGATCFSTPHMNKIPGMRVSGMAMDNRERERISRIPMTLVGICHDCSLYPQFLACFCNSIPFNFKPSCPLAFFVLYYHSWWGIPVFVHVHKAANNSTSIEIRN